MWVNYPGNYGLLTLDESNGVATAVPEEEIVSGIELLAEQEGIFTETAGGVVIAGLRRLVNQGVIKKDEPTVAYITGNGLKTQEAFEDLITTTVIEPTLTSFERVLAIKG